MVGDKQQKLEETETSNAVVAKKRNNLCRCCKGKDLMKLAVG